MNKRKKINKTMESLSKYYFDRKKTTLNRMRKKPDAFKILISCLLSLRTQDKNTEIASKKLFAIASTPKQILKLKTLCQKCKPSENWFGLYSPKEKIKKSGLWLVNELYKVPLSDKDIEELKNLLNINKNE
jgi:Predicted EndoIII-related endonuclease